MGLGGGGWIVGGAGAGVELVLSKLKLDPRHGLALAVLYRLISA